jgi:hypothetical protein
MRIRLWLNLLFALFVGFLTLPKSLATLTVAAPTKFAGLADFNSVTTTTTEASVLSSGGATGSGAVCLGRARASSLLPTGTRTLNCRTFDENQSTLAAETTVSELGALNRHPHENRDPQSTTRRWRTRETKLALGIADPRFRPPSPIK